MRKDGSECPALTWLKGCVRGDTTSGGTGASKTIVVRARGTSGQESVTLKIGTTTVKTWTLSTTTTNYSFTTTAAGGAFVQYTTDASGRDGHGDCLSVNGTVREAEAQTCNTGAYQIGACGGGSGKSEWLNCNGSIGFGDL